MPSSKFIVESVIRPSFRVEKVKGMFDVEMQSVKKEFDVNIPIENKAWNIGLIVGASGSGKTTIAKNVFKNFELFSGFDWSDRSVVDDFKDDLSAKQITESLSKVGFSSPPDWLKPFAVLSNGQKMRVELARLILECNKPVIYDEFTSVVDRQVAKIGSAAIQKFIRKNNKQFIAVSCHFDIIEWLQPDWVYDCNSNQFKWVRLRRPEIQINIRKAQQSEWALFRPFHYLSSAHNASAHKYIAEYDGQPIGWCSVLHLPHPSSKKLKRLHRTVVLPDFQGLGIGFQFRCFICELYRQQGFKVTTVTSSPALIHAMNKSDRWVMTRKPSRIKKPAHSILSQHSFERLTCAFQYVGNEKPPAK